jgi:hypothetical protein
MGQKNPTFFWGSARVEKAKKKSNYANHFGPSWLTQGHERIENQHSSIRCQVSNYQMNFQGQFSCLFRFIKTQMSIITYPLSLQGLDPRLLNILKRNNH